MGASRVPEDDPAEIIKVHASNSAQSSGRSSAAGAIARGSSTAFIGMLIGALLNFGYNVGIARLYGASAIGIFAFGLSLVSITAVVGQLGAKELLLRYVASYQSIGDHRRLRGVLTFGVGLGMLGSLGGYVLLAGVVDQVAFWANKPEAIPVLRWLVIAMPLLTGIMIAAAILQGMRRIDLYTLMQEVGRGGAVAAGLAAAAVLALDFLDFIRLYLVMLALVLTMGVWLVHKLYVHHVASGTRSLTEGRTWIGFALSVMFLDVFRSSFMWLDTLVLSFFVPAADVGIYFSALRTALLITLALAAFNAILSPMAADFWYRGDVEGLRRAFRTTTRWTCLVVLPTAVVLILLRTDIMAIFGEEFSSPEAGLVLMIILLGRVGNGVTGGVGRLLIMTGHQRLEIYNMVLNLSFLGGGLLFAVPRYGIAGAAVVNALAVVLINMVKLVQVWKKVGVQPYDRSYLRLVLATGASLAVGGGIAAVAESLPVAARIILVAGGVAGVYGTVLFSLGIEPEDRQILQGIRARITRLPTDQ